MKFDMEETMYGHYRLIGGDHRQGRLDFHVRFGSDDWIQMVKTKKTVLTGKVDMEGFARAQPLEGTLLVDIFGDKILVYDFTFHSDDGKLMHFYGKKDVRYLNLPKTMTTLYGVVERDNVPFAEVESHFRFRDLPGFLASFRLGTGKLG